MLRVDCPHKGVGKMEDVGVDQVSLGLQQHGQNLREREEGRGRKGVGGREREEGRGRREVTEGRERVEGRGR